MSSVGPLMPPRGPNLFAKIDTVEDGVVRVRLRGGRGNRLYETWHIFDSGPHGFKIHAERYDREGDLIAEMDSLPNTNAACRFLTEGAWHTHHPESITIYPAQIDRAVHR